MSGIRVESGQSVQPLQWPDYRLKPDALQRFLKGMPFIGIDKRAFSDIKRQLGSRPTDAQTVWSARLRPFHEQVSQLIQEYMYWPNTRFIPDDLCSILFFDPSIELRAAELMAVLEDRYGHDLFDDFFASLTYGELLERIANKGAAELPKIKQF